MKKIKWIIISTVICLLVPMAVIAAAEDYLVLQDIGSYKFITQNIHPLTKKITIIPGYTTRTAPGILAGASHFHADHDDTTYETVYESDVTDLGVRVQITQHTGADSDRWLLHEVESSFRGREKEGWLGQGLRGSASIREINGNKIFDYGNIDYRWIDNNVVVYIHYTDLEGTKPEPLEIVQAYLQKFPSTITLTDEEAKSNAHNEKWIKDEMERRLWLGDKWFMALQIKKAEETAVYKNTVDSMLVFLDYREKYYGISATDEKNLLLEYQQANNGTMIRNKLQEYKSWWTENKDKQISMQ